MNSPAARRRPLFAAILLVSACWLPAAAQEPGRGVYTPPAAGAIHAVAAEHGMVVAQEKIAARIGADVLKRGGNAVDAAVATGFAMAVTYPRAGNIGGGGFMVIHLAERHRGRRDRLSRDRAGFDHAADIPGPRRQAGQCAGRAIPRSASACPARWRAWRWHWRNMAPGRFTLADLLQPAIDLARDGIVLADDMADTLPGSHRPAGALAGFGEDLFPRRWQLAARRRPPGADRPGGDAAGDRRAGTARILPGTGRGKTGEGDRDAGGIMTAGRSEILSARDPRAGARQLSRL